MCLVMQTWVAAEVTMALEPCCGWCSQELLLSWPNPLQAASAWLGNSVYARWKFSWPLGTKFVNLSFRVTIYLSKRSPFSLWEDRTKQTRLFMPVLYLYQRAAPSPCWDKLGWWISAHRGFQATLAKQKEKSFCSVFAQHLTQQSPGALLELPGTSTAQITST